MMNDHLPGHDGPAGAEGFDPDLYDESSEPQSTPVDGDGVPISAPTILSGAALVGDDDDDVDGDLSDDDLSDDDLEENGAP